MNFLILSILLTFVNQQMNNRDIDSLFATRDALRINLDSALRQNQKDSLTQPAVINLYKDIISIDDQLLKFDKPDMTQYAGERENLRNSLNALNDKLDLVNDRRIKLERTVLILVLVLLMLTFYIFKLQRRN